MFKRVDDSAANPIRGFSYVSKSRIQEGVRLDDSTVEIIYVENEGPNSSIYYEDIPLLIKALQAAYDYKKGVA